MKRRVGCLIFALLFALFFVFYGMLCRLALPISPDAPASWRIQDSSAGHLEFHGVPDVVD